MIAQTQPMEWTPIIIGVLGGLTLFLFGMEQMTSALKLLAGNKLKTLLAKMTTNRFSGMIVGAFVTAVIQSSSVTTVLVVGFVSAGLMNLSQCVGIIMGANIGSTFTAQVIAFKITKAAIPILIGGYFVYFLSKHERWRETGRMIFGLGLVFFGMNFMSDATYPLRQYPAFMELMQEMSNPFYGIAVGALVTGVIQSSAVTSGLVIILGTQGSLDLSGAIAILFGANIGTCITAMLAAIGKPREGVQAAVIHLLFNVAGVALWIAFIPLLAQGVANLSPDNIARQIANAHTLFNIANALIFIGFAGFFAMAARKLVPERATPLETQTRYLNEIYLKAPTQALDRVYLELARHLSYSLNMIRSATEGALNSERPALEDAAEKEKQIDLLHAATLGFLGKIAEERLSENQQRHLQAAISVANRIESMGDVVETEIVPGGLDHVAREDNISPQMKESLEVLVNAVCENIDMMVRALPEFDASLAQDVINNKRNINELADAATQDLHSRLAGRDAQAIKRFRFEVDLIESLKRLYYFTKQIAKSIQQAKETSKS